MKARATLRAWGWRVAPAAMANRGVRFEIGLREEWGLPRMAETFIAAHGDRVLTGPVRGLRYTPDGDAPVAKLLGTYEEEIEPWLEEALASPPRTFVDLGAADGYFAIGIKVRCPEMHVIAFEMARIPRKRLKTLSALNGAEVELRSRATARAIGRLRLRDALVLCDIDGAEADALEPDSLASCTVIVELHEGLRPGVTALLVDRFAGTHDVDLVDARLRDPAAYPQLEVLAVADRQMAVHEHRGPMTWARFTPRGQT